MHRAHRLPDYAETMALYHRAYARELRAVVDALPLRVGDRVLDLACGDGAYSGWLARRVGPSGLVAAVDLSRAFLNLARSATEGEGVHLVTAAGQRLPFADGSFDLVWCAQSLYSLPDPVEAVRWMTRAVRPGGTVAVLENDTLHHILLPWPIEVELAVRAAELRGFAEESDRPWKFYVGRQLRDVFDRAGLECYRHRTLATNRHAPLEPDERGFFSLFLQNLRHRARPHLTDPVRTRFDRLVDPGSEDYILDQPGLTVTCIDHVVSGVRPGG
jgi:SAM-dependent methyltransferase